MKSYTLTKDATGTGGREKAGGRRQPPAGGGHRLSGGRLKSKAKRRDPPPDRRRLACRPEVPIRHATRRSGSPGFWTSVGLGPARPAQTSHLRTPAPPVAPAAAGVTLIRRPPDRIFPAMAEVGRRLYCAVFMASCMRRDAGRSFLFHERRDCEAAIGPFCSVVSSPATGLPATTPGVGAAARFGRARRSA